MQKVARYQELATALHAFLTRVAGWARTAEAVLVAEQYYTTARYTLSARLGSLSETSKQQREALPHQVQQRQQAFERDWGEHGQRRRELLEHMRRITAVAARHFRQIVQPGGDIQRMQHARIEALTSLATADQHGKALADEVVATVLVQWQRLCREAHVQCLSLLTPFLQAAEAVDVPHTDPSGLVVREQPLIRRETDWYDKLKGLSREVMPVVALGGIAAVFFPVSAIITAGLTAVALWRWIRGDERAQLEPAKQALRQHLADVLQRVQQHFFDVDLTVGRSSKVEEYFMALERAMAEQVHLIATRKSAEAGAEIARLNKAAQLDEQQRHTQAARIQQHLAVWDDLGKTLQALAAQLKALDARWAAATAPGSAGQQEVL